MAAWTQDEIEYLKENYSTAPKDELLKHVNHPWYSIVSMCSRLKIRRPHKEYFSPERRAEIDAVILEKYQGSEVGQLEDELGISRTSLDRFAKELGVVRYHAHLRKRIQVEVSQGLKIQPTTKRNDVN